MIMIAPIYLPCLMLIGCCMPTCTCTHAKLIKMSFFLDKFVILKCLSFGDGGSI
jgi:hypothetical protein